MECPTCGSHVRELPLASLPDEMGAAILNRMNQREREIIRMVALGLPNEVIADRLQTTESAVKCCLTHIMRKTEQVNRIGLAVFVVRHRMVLL